MGFMDVLKKYVLPAASIAAAPGDIRHSRKVAEKLEARPCQVPMLRQCHVEQPKGGVALPQSGRATLVIGQPDDEQDEREERDRDERQETQAQRRDASTRWSGSALVSGGSHAMSRKLR